MVIFAAFLQDALFTINEVSDVLGAQKRDCINR